MLANTNYTVTKEGGEKKEKQGGIEVGKEEEG